MELAEIPIKLALIPMVINFKIDKTNQDYPWRLFGSLRQLGRVAHGLSPCLAFRSWEECSDPDEDLVVSVSSEQLS